MKILQIMCHPDYNGEHRVSNIFAKIGEEKLVEEGFISIEKITLYDPSVHIQSWISLCLIMKEKN